MARRQAQKSGMRARFGGFLIAVVLCIATMPIFVQAATAPQGVTLEPAIENLSVTPGQSSPTFALKVTNHTASAIRFALSTVDFKSLDESGGVAFVGPSGGDLVNTYGLATWVELGASEMTVESGAQQSVNVTIRNDDTLTAGGHYAAILLNAESPDQAQAGNQVGLKQTLSVPLFITKSDGTEHYDLKLDKIDSKTSQWQLPTEATLRFYNPGDVQLEPRGLVKVLDPRGNVVGQGIINEGSGMILPQTYRRYNVSLQPLAKAWLPGKYTISVQYRYDGYDTYATKNVTFFFFGSLIKDAGAVAAVLLLVFAGWALRRKIEPESSRRTVVKK